MMKEYLAWLNELRKVFVVWWMGDPDYYAPGKVLARKEWRGGGYYASYVDGYRKLQTYYNKKCKMAFQLQYHWDYKHYGDRFTMCWDYIQEDAMHIPGYHPFAKRGEELRPNPYLNR